MVVSSIIASIFVAAFTAIITVGLTLYGTSRKRRYDAVRAVQFEIDTNVDIAEEIVDYLESDIEQRRTERSGRVVTSRRHDTIAFESMVNRGDIMSLNDETRRTLAKHYEYIQVINKDLSHRDHLRDHLDEYTSAEFVEKWFAQRFPDLTAPEEQQILISFNSVILVHLYLIHPEKVKDVNSMVKQKMLELFDDKQSLEEISRAAEKDEPPKIEFTDVQQMIQAVVDSHRILSRIPGV